METDETSPSRLRLLLLILLFFLSPRVQAQPATPAQLGFEAHSLEDPELGTINYYVTGGGQNSSKPLLVYLDGSGPFPLFQQMDRGLGSSVVIDWQNLREEYRIVLIGKPGVPFADSMEVDPRRGPQYEPPPEYHRRLSLDWRVASADRVVNRLLEESANREVIVFGFSEGAQVAANLAPANPEIDYVLMYSGNGLNQLYDFVIRARLKAERGQITHQEAQAEVDSLYRTFREIYAHPESTDRFWQGHTYKRWASFANQPPVEALTRVDIPVYIANGSRDRNPVLSADYTKLAFLKLGKDNITYRVYPGFDHQFNEHRFEDGEFKGATPRIREVIADGFDWLESQRNGRE